MEDDHAAAHIAMPPLASLYSARESATSVADIPFFSSISIALRKVSFAGWSVVSPAIVNVNSRGLPSSSYHLPPLFLQPAACRNCLPSVNYAS